jgi:hypothetical protein
MSYYGTIAVYSNFIAKPLVTPTGAALDPNDAEAVPGALNMGKQVAFSLTTFNAFWVYVCPLFGAWIADTYLGRYKTILYSVLIAEIGHLILVASAAPSVIKNEKTSLGVFILGLIIMGLGTGTFKPNIAPLIAEQVPQEKMRVEVRGTERVIVDPAVTVTRIYVCFPLPPLISLHSLTDSSELVLLFHQHRRSSRSDQHGVRGTLRRILLGLPHSYYHVRRCYPCLDLLQEILHPAPTERQRYGSRLQAALQGSWRGNERQPDQDMEELELWHDVARCQAIDLGHQQAKLVQLRRRLG